MCEHVQTDFSLERRLLHNLHLALFFSLERLQKLKHIASVALCLLLMSKQQKKKINDLHFMWAVCVFDAQTKYIKSQLYWNLITRRRVKNCLIGIGNACEMFSLSTIFSALIFFLLFFFVLFFCCLLQFSMILISTHQRRICFGLFTYESSQNDRSIEVIWN